MKKKIKKFIEIFIKLDDKLYKLIIKKRYNEFYNKVNFYTKSIANYNNKSRY